MRFIILLLVLTFAVKLYAKVEFLTTLNAEIEKLRKELTGEFDILKNEVTSTRNRRESPCVACRKGERGLDGRDGLPGANGEQGVIGSIGQKGVSAAFGQKGEPGVHGCPGVPGFPGANGEKGEAGVLVMEGSRLMMSVFDIVVHLFFWSPDQGVWGCFLRHRL